MARLVAEKSDVVPLIAEIFRENGYQGASLSLITARTGLGKGSLYHFFPGGKPEMASVVLDDIEAWFENNIFLPLDRDPDGRHAVELMFDAVTAYFRSGRRVCLVGAMALDSSREPFADKIAGYFRRWVDVLSSTLVRAGFPAADAARISYEVVGGIQGAIVLSRAIDESTVFLEAVSSLRARCIPPP